MEEFSWADVRHYLRCERQRYGDGDETASCTDRRQKQRRRSPTAQSCVCLLLCVLGTVATSVCFAMASMTATRPVSRAQAALEQVKQAAVVEFSVTIKERSREGEQDSGVTQVWRRPRRAFYSYAAVKANGTLIPRTSEDSGHLRFDGWIRVETNASQRHEMAFANHRGYRTVRELPSLRITSEGCLTTADIPPLHVMEAVARSAFRAEELSAFGTNCSRGQAVEVVFVGVPFVHCFARPAALHPELLPHSSEGVHEAAAATTLVFHGEQIAVEATMKAKERPTLLSNDSSSGGSGVGDSVETGSAAYLHELAKSVPAACMYLEAPLSSGQEKQSLLYQLLPPR